MGFLSNFLAHLAANEISEKKRVQAEIQREEKAKINNEMSVLQLERDFIDYLISINCRNAEWTESTNREDIWQTKSIISNYKQKLKEFISLGGNPFNLYDLNKMDLYIEIIKRLKDYGWLDRQEQYIKYADSTYWLDSDWEKEQEKRKWLSVLLNVQSNELKQILTKESADFIPYNDTSKSDVFCLDNAYFAAPLQDKSNDNGVFDAPISIKFTEKYILFYSNKHDLDSDGNSIYTHDEIYYKSNISNKKVEILATSFAADLDGATINDVYVILKKDRPWLTEHFYDIHNLTVLVENKAASDSIDSLSGIEFENVCKRLLENMGFEVETTKASGDGGIDLIAHNYQPMLSGKYIIQCKRYTGSVGEPIIRDLYGVITSERANKGILMTSGTFTKQAQVFAQDKQIELIDGVELKKLLAKY